MRISIIIPTYNEEEQIASTIQIIKNRATDTNQLQIIVVDGGSEDRTVIEAQNEGAVIVHASATRRSIKMNKGAEIATGDVFYFLHADTHPPQYFDELIKQQLEEGYPAGCFQLSFDSESPLLSFYGWCTRFDIDGFRFGDQSLFIKPQVFRQIGGFQDDFYLMEGHEMVKNIKKEYSFAICKQTVVTSSRKYDQNGALRLQFIYLIIVMLCKLGVAQPKLFQFYIKWVH